MEDTKIKQLKAKYKEIFEISAVDDKGNEYKAVFKKVDIKVLSLSGKYAQDDPVKAAVILFDNCWIEGDEEIKNNDELKLSFATKLAETFKVYEATIKKL
jgi:hypothetical protein